MKKLSIFVALFSCVSVYAKGTSTITCLVKEDFDEKKTEVKVEFLVKDLGTKKAELVQHPKANSEMGAILVTPEEVRGRYSNMTHLNGQGGDLRVGEDRIRLFGDGDGYTFVDLVLFKESGYTKGYVRVSGSGDQMFQKLNCTVK